MPKIVVVGGGLIGMAAGMLLARDGCEVTVLEGDGEAVPGSPGSAWQDWGQVSRVEDSAATRSSGAASPPASRARPAASRSR